VLECTIIAYELYAYIDLSTKSFIFNDILYRFRISIGGIKSG